MAASVALMRRLVDESDDGRTASRAAVSCPEKATAVVSRRRRRAAGKERLKVTAVDRMLPGERAAAKGGGGVGGGGVGGGGEGGGG